jgi:hypothetical protein
MQRDTPEHDTSPLSAEGVAEWSRHVECVLRGLAHALNNRAAALSAVVELSTEPAEEPPVIRAILDTELERVQALVRVVRSIGTPSNAVEAFTPGDAAAEASAVLDLHADQRTGVVSIDTSQGQPIRAPRWMFVRALIALATGMGNGTSGAQTGSLTVAVEGEWLVMSARGNGIPSAVPVLAADLARAMGGEPLRDRYGVRVPTLAALRQREGR